MKAIQYPRVIPRDFFNEAKLLKCMGQLALKIHESKLPEGISVKIEESGEPFKILAEDEYLFVSNYPATINDKPVRFLTTYNSRSVFPLVCRIGYDEYEVFEDDGEFSEEFKQLKDM